MPELNLNRRQLATFLKDPESIKKFERLFTTVIENASMIEELIALVYSLGDSTGNVDDTGDQLLDASLPVKDYAGMIYSYVNQLEHVKNNISELTKRIDSIEVSCIATEHSNYVHRSHDERIRGVKTFTQNNNPAPLSVKEAITRFVGNDSTDVALEITSFAGLPELWFRSHDGTALSPSAVPTGYYLASIRGYGYTGSGYNGNTSIIFYTNEAWGGAGEGSGIALNVTMTGYTTIVPIVFSAEKIGTDNCLRMSVDNLRIFNTKFGIFGANPVVRQTKSTPYAGITLTGHGSVWDAAEAAIANTNYNNIAAALTAIDNRVTNNENALIAYGALA